MKQIYDKRLLTRYRLGFANLVDRPTVQVTELSKGEQRSGIAGPQRCIRTFWPPIVCFIGKVTCNVFCGSRQCGGGWQESISSSRLCAMHFPMRGSASVRIEGLRELKAVSSRRE
ncbi:MAG: hypothetical protein JW955_22835 [Sedimentisphaerales bacterium]|nr:hypothetical protein [Sedimentisphaerales bacterium]